MLPGLAPLGLDIPEWQGHTNPVSGSTGYWSSVGPFTLVEDGASEDVTVTTATGNGPVLTFNTTGTYDFTFTWGGTYTGNSNDAANAAMPFFSGTASQPVYVSHTGVTNGYGYHAPNASMVGANSGSGTASYVYTVTVSAGQTLILYQGVGNNITLTNVAFTNISLKRRD